MKKISLLLSVLIFAAALADAPRPAPPAAGLPVNAGSPAGVISPAPLSRPKFSQSTSAHATSLGAASRTGFTGAAGARGRSTFAGAKLTGTGTGGTTTSATPATSPSSAIGAKVLTLGEQPTYSNAAGGGTASVNGGGFIAIDQSKANDVGRSPGVTWGPADTPPSSGRPSGGGAGASANRTGSQSRFLQMRG